MSTSHGTTIATLVFYVPPSEAGPFTMANLRALWGCQRALRLLAATIASKKSLGWDSEGSMSPGGEHLGFRFLAAEAGPLAVELRLMPGLAGRIPDIEAVYHEAAIRMHGTLARAAVGEAAPDESWEGLYALQEVLRDLGEDAGLEFCVEATAARVMVGRATGAVLGGWLVAAQPESTEILGRVTMVALTGRTFTMRSENGKFVSGQYRPRDLPLLAKALASGGSTLARVRGTLRAEDEGSAFFQQVLEVEEVLEVARRDADEGRGSE